MWLATSLQLGLCLARERLVGTYAGRSQEMFVIAAGPAVGPAARHPSSLTVTIGSADPSNRAREGQLTVHQSRERPVDHVHVAGGCG